MSLAVQLAALSTRVAQEIKALRLARGLPGGFQSGTSLTRRAQFAWGAGNAGTWTGGVLDSGQQRLPIRLPVTTTRWRLRVSNQTSMGTKYPGVNFTGAWIGTGGVDAVTGKPNGTWPFVPTQALTAFSTAADGGEVVTSWVTNPAHQITGGSPNSSVFQIGLGWNKMTAGTTIAQGASGMWFTQTASEVNSTTASIGYAGNIAFSVILEYEFVGTQRIYLALGDSITEGSGTELSINSWHQVLSMQMGVPVCMTAAFGSNVGNWSATTIPGYQRILNAGLNIDAAIVILGVNDVAAGFPVTALSTFQSGVKTVVTNLRSTLGISRVYWGTITPRSDSEITSTQELTRAQYNAWLTSGLPFLDGVVDAASAIEDAPGGNISRAGLTVDGLHWNNAGNWRVAQNITIPD